MNPFKPTRRHWTSVLPLVVVAAFAGVAVSIALATSHGPISGERSFRDSYQGLLGTFRTSDLLVDNTASIGTANSPNINLHINGKVVQDVVSGIFPSHASYLLNVSGSNYSGADGGFQVFQTTGYDTTVLPTAQSIAGFFGNTAFVQSGSGTITNYGILSNVSGGTQNFSFYGVNGTILNVGSASFGDTTVSSISSAGSAAIVGLVNGGTTTLGAAPVGSAVTINGTLDVRNNAADDWVSIQSAGRKFYIESSGGGGTQPNSLNIYDNTSGAVRWYVRNAGDVVNVNNLTIGGGAQVLSGGTPSANFGTPTTTSTDWSGDIKTVGAHTAVVLTYSAAFPHFSRCTVSPISASVAPEYILPVAIAASVTFSCFAISSGLASNCDDFTYNCIGQ